MKKITIILVLIMCLVLSACGSHDAVEDNSSGDDAAAIGIEEKADADNDNDEETEEMSDNNRTIIAEALGVDENSRSLRFHLYALNEVNAGEIKSAVAGSDGNDKYIEVVAEDDTVYRIYLSGSGSVDAVKNMDTGEWPISSER